MRRTFLSPIQVAILLALAAATFDAAADAKAGEKKAQLCLLCHKADNYWGGGVPLLEAQPAPYIVAATNAFKTGKRTSEAMQSNVASLSARDIADIADYFASRPSNGAQAVDAAKAAAGEAKVRALECATCHQAGFTGLDAVPRLAGQSSVYLAAQLDAFAAGRRAHPRQEMPAGADAESVAAYLAGLREVNR